MLLGSRSASIIATRSPIASSFARLQQTKAFIHPRTSQQPHISRTFTTASMAPTVPSVKLNNGKEVSMAEFARLSRCGD